MPTTPTPVRHGFTLLLACAAFWLLADTTQAQTPQQRRLVLDIELQRQGPVQHGIERGEQQLSQRWQFSALLETDGAPAPYNVLDPAEQHRQLADAERRVAATRGASRGPAPDVAALQAQAQALQARCGQDSACLMREASALVTAGMAAGQPPGVSGSPAAGRQRLDAASQARLQAYGQAVAACERQPAGSAREACRAQARRQAGGGAELPEDNEPAAPFLVFNGMPACELRLASRIDERVKGSYNDVQGVVRTAETAQGQETRRDDQWCPSLMAVLDTRNGRLWVSLNLVPRDVMGVSTREEGNRPSQRRDGRIALRWWEADDWVAQRLTRLSPGGQDQARLPAGPGQAEIRMSWSFKPA